MSHPALKEATLTELLAEIARRFEEQPPLVEWAAPVLVTVASYYSMPIELLRSTRRNDAVARVKHLVIALLAHLHPMRTQAEVCDVLNLEHSMYRHALRKTDETIQRWPMFAEDVKTLLANLKAQGHCRASPQGTRPLEDVTPLLWGKTPPPVKTAIQRII